MLDHIYGQNIKLNLLNNQKKEILSNKSYNIEILLLESKKRDSVNLFLVEYPIYNCSNNHVNFIKKGTSRIISLKSSNSNNSLNQLSEIRFIHMKYQLLLPVESFNDIYEPRFCDFIYPKKPQKLNKPTKNIITQYIKAYGSKDGKRIYIMLTNRESENLYQITWVIENGRYIGRIVEILT